MGDDTRPILEGAKPEATNGSKRNATQASRFIRARDAMYDKVTNRWGGELMM